MKRRKNDLEFYDKFKQEKEINKKIEKVKEKYNISDDQNVVIEERTLFDKIFSKILIIIGDFVKVVFFILVFLLASIGTTVLLNSNLRNEFINLFINNLN